MKYRVRETFKYEPAYGRVDDENKTTVFNKGEIYEFEPYTGRCCKPGEMRLITEIEPKMNQNWVWRPDYFREHFEIVMSELNLAEILKDCPKGTKLYSSMFGDVYFIGIKDTGRAAFIEVETCCNTQVCFYPDGKFNTYYPDSEVTLFPSKENRDWSTFNVKKPKFDIHSLQPFDTVLVRDTDDEKWRASLFSHLNGDKVHPFACGWEDWEECIPCNDDTKHLVGTKDPAPDFYVTWEE